MKIIGKTLAGYCKKIITFGYVFNQITKAMITKNIKVPTGNICIMNGDKGNLEFLSIGDYGKDANIKADFLGITREINGVPNGEIMPLSEKWVITISTQYGCSMGCKFCDVPKVGPGLNATLEDLINQVYQALLLHPEVTGTNRLNIHFARMGEPTFNKNVLTAGRMFYTLFMDRLAPVLVHPVVSTMMPKNNHNLTAFLRDWCEMKNYYYGDAGLQFSINSTDDTQREQMFSGSSLSLTEISNICAELPFPIGRKYALNFALANEYVIDADKLARLFNPERFMVKITPIHETKASVENGINTEGGYTSFTPYHDAESRLKKAGFDVIVFIPSLDEDRGMITCGNAILSGKMPDVKFEILNL